MYLHKNLTNLKDFEIGIYERTYKGFFDCVLKKYWGHFTSFIPLVKTTLR